MTEAAFQATYSDLKVIKGRKVAQVVLEVPLEQSDHAMEVLGGLPRPDAETWVAVARLVKEADKPKEKTEGGRAVVRAALLCREQSFRTFCGAATDIEAAAHIRMFCHIESRSELATNPDALAKFKKLDNEYKDWLRYGGSNG